MDILKQVKPEWHSELGRYRKERDDSFLRTLAKAPEGPQDAEGRVVVTRVQKRVMAYSTLWVDNEKVITALSYECFEESDSP